MAKTKIETYKDLRYKMKRNLDDVKNCNGYSNKNGTYVLNSSIDKKGFKFSTLSHHSSKPIYLDAYYGYYGDSNVSMLNDEFYVECMTEAINNHMDLLMRDTEKIMQNKCNEALLKAKEEAEVIIQEVKDLE